MDTTPESTDNEDEEDWMAINWDSNFTSGTKELCSKSCPDGSGQSVSGKDITIWLDASVIHVITWFLCEFIFFPLTLVY